MNKTILMFITILFLILGACAETEEEKETVEPSEVSSEENEELNEKKEISKEEIENEKKPKIKVGEKDILKKDIKTVFATGLDEPEGQISEEDYKKYRDIMDYLYEYPDKEEDVLFKELESEYNESSEELQKFVNDNMTNAIAYESGKSTNNVTLKESDIKSSIEKFFKENVSNKDKLEINTDKAEVEMTNLRSISKGELLYNNHSYDYIIKTEHDIDLQKVEIFQLKMNEENIDFE